MRGSSGGAAHCASSSDTIESRAVLSDTLSPRRQRASPGMASGPKLRKRAERVVSGKRRRRVQARHGVLALARHEGHERARERIVAAAGAKKAGCVLVTGEGRARVSRERARQVG